MILGNLNFFEKAKLIIVNKISPIKTPGILLLDKIEVELKETKINQIDISYILVPQITSNLCPVVPESNELKISLSYTQIITCQNANCFFQGITIGIDDQTIGKQIKIICPICGDSFLYSVSEDEFIVDFTNWVKEQIFSPNIYSFSVTFDKAILAGKSYKQNEEIHKHMPQFSEYIDKDCIHGLEKSWCSLCLQKKRQKTEKGFSRINLFDLIFPILQPPFGENFDSPIVFPVGKELYPFQLEGIRFLASKQQALLGDEMGLGKSIQTIVAIRFLFRMGKITNSLILCPKSVLSDWEKKLEEWAPELRVLKICGTKNEREIGWNTPAHIYLTTYETLRQDVENMPRKDFDLVVLDEVQKIKNPSANITKSTRQIKAHWRWGLSGTPLENRLEELISIFAYLNPGLLHYYDAANPLKVKETIKPYFLRRRKKDVLPELPKKVYEEVWLELSPAQRQAYDKAEQEGIVALNEQGDSITVKHILALITKLKQICNLEPISKESCKRDYLLEKLEDISEQNDKAIVFSQFPNKTLKFLETELGRFNPLVYHGSLSVSQQDEIIRKFNDEEENRLLLMSVKAGGLGLTLTRANYVYHFDLWWNPAVAAQAEDRVHRIGQERTVFVTSLFTVDTVEEKIQNLLKKKQELFEEIIDDLSDTNLSKVLTEEELFSLFNLQKAKPKRYLS